jgi:hypothetical protein
MNDDRTEGETEHQFAENSGQPNPGCTGRGESAANEGYCEYR